MKHHALSQRGRRALVRKKLTVQILKSAATPTWGLQDGSGCHELRLDHSRWTGDLPGGAGRVIQRSDGFDVLIAGLCAM
jgi:hypothetical protein